MLDSSYRFLLLFLTQLDSGVCFMKLAVSAYPLCEQALHTLTFHKISRIVKYPILVR